MCSTGARASANRLKLAIHDVGIDETNRGVLEGLRKAAHNFKAKTLPQPDGALVRADHEVELHSAKPTLSRALQRMRAHGASHSPARRVRRGHVAAIGYVRAPSFLIGFQKVCADHF